MWKKIKCLLGWHEWIESHLCFSPEKYDCSGIRCKDCDYGKCCKYCGKRKI